MGCTAGTRAVTGEQLVENKASKLKQENQAGAAMVQSMGVWALR